jgi:hypothetical protein
MLCRENCASGPDGNINDRNHRPGYAFFPALLRSACAMTPKVKNGIPMLRLTLILCIGLFAALMIAGEDRGQLRPGLADAAATAPLAAAESPEPADPVEPLTVVDAAPAPAAPRTQPAEVVAAAPEPEPYVEPAREVVTVLEEPVFSLAASGNETVAAAEPEPEALADGAGTIWYVVANSVNVRAGPSTDAEVLGKLGTGEATLLVQSVDDEWARIVIQGDGVEGFIAKRYLSPVAP